MSAQLTARPLTEARLSGHWVCDSWCGTCDGRPAQQVAVYAASASSRADEAAAALGGEAHIHYIARGDRLSVVVPAGARAS
ncbi:hypothetical protein ACTVZO_38505 [Streptomyces sp. IBSNAI002]|uniref:hypothetical protein n=1 Tax=Streptomyces sp. IBSNAI002 TaxID=3457500 RepID=UPI003FD60D06